MSHVTLSSTASGNPPSAPLVNPSPAAGPQAISDKLPRGIALLTNAITYSPLASFSDEDYKKKVSDLLRAMHTQAKAQISFEKFRELVIEVSHESPSLKLPVDLPGFGLRLEQILENIRQENPDKFIAPRTSFFEKAADWVYSFWAPAKPELAEDTSEPTPAPTPAPTPTINPSSPHESTMAERKELHGSTADAYRPMSCVTNETHMEYSALFQIREDGRPAFLRLFFERRPQGDGTFIRANGAPGYTRISPVLDRTYPEGFSQKPDLYVTLHETPHETKFIFSHIYWPYQLPNGTTLNPVVLSANLIPENNTFAYSNIAVTEENIIKTPYILKPSINANNGLPSAHKTYVDFAGGRHVIYCPNSDGTYLRRNFNPYEEMQIGELIKDPVISPTHAPSEMPSRNPSAAPTSANPSTAPTTQFMEEDETILGAEKNTVIASASAAIAAAVAAGAAAYYWREKICPKNSGIAGSGVAPS